MPVHHPADELIPTIGYIRVSLAREEMISPELQRESITEWAKRTRHRIIDWVEDLDKTGRNFNRKIMKVIERVEAGEARVIAVWKYSRFGRSREGCATNLARVERAGGQVLTSAENFDTTTPEGRLGRGVMMEFNAYESDRAGVQWKETQQWRRDNGLPATGKKRFGYTWQQRKIYNPDGSIVLREERYEPHPTQGPVVTSLYERIIDGEAFRSIAFWLNAHGFETVRGEKWSGKAVRRMLDSGFAAGYLRLHADCPEAECYGNCPNYKLVKHPTKHHPTLITEEVWQQYLKRRAVIHRISPRAQAPQYPFTGLVRCGLCQGGARRFKYPTGEVRHGCTLKHDKGAEACSGTLMKEGNLKAALLAFLRSVAAPAVEQWAKVEEDRVTPFLAEAPAEESETVRLQGQVARLERAIGKHMKTYALSDEDDPDGILEKEYRATLNQLREEKAGVLAELEAIVSQETRVEDSESAQASAVHVAIGLLAEWDTLPPARINFLLRCVIKAVVLRSDACVDVLPLWDADEWSWSAPLVVRPLSKSDVVRVVAQELREECGRVTSQQISVELARRGVTASADHVRSVLSRDARLAARELMKGSDLA